jgi:meso-butanediol dehydrogenase / (S,S)-butanediol dehydrogenase / diacetyl reductase
VRLDGKRVLITGTGSPGGQGAMVQAIFARECARVNAISPGLVKTPSTDKFVGDELRAFQMNMHLIRRPGTGEDIAYLAMYLASDESTWVTGQNYSIDGGVTAGFR